MEVRQPLVPPALCWNLQLDPAAGPLLSVAPGMGLWGVDAKPCLLHPPGTGQ